jgi:hypothetical protein
MPRLIRVIESEITRGEGDSADDRCRAVRQYHTTDGELLAETDISPSLADAVHFVLRNFDENQRARIAKRIVELPK